MTHWAVRTLPKGEGPGRCTAEHANCYTPSGGGVLPSMLAATPSGSGILLGTLRLAPS